MVTFQRKNFSKHYFSYQTGATDPLKSTVLSLTVIDTRAHTYTDSKIKAGCHFYKLVTLYKMGIWVL